MPAFKKFYKFWIFVVTNLGLETQLGTYLSTSFSLLGFMVKIEFELWCRDSESRKDELILLIFYSINSLSKSEKHRRLCNPMSYCNYHITQSEVGKQLAVWSLFLLLLKGMCSLLSLFLIAYMEKRVIFKRTLSLSSHTKSYIITL